MKIKTEDLIGVELDWAVAKCERTLDPVHGEPQPRVVFYSDQWNRYMRLNPPPQVYYNDRYEPSTSWAQAGPIIERERIGIWPSDALKGLWAARPDYEVFPERRPPSYGVTPLIAAMRCYVASKLGDEVEVPEELIKENQS